MRMSVAKIGNRSAELVLDLLSIANNMSVRMFLHNIFEDDELEYFDDPKRALMNHLLQYMTKYIEMHIPKKEGVLELKIRYDKNTPYFIPSVPFIEDVYVPLYLHLHLLSENYYSYRVVTNQNILDGQLSNDISNNSKNKNKGDISKKGSLTKLLHLLIESSIDNKELSETDNASLNIDKGSHNNIDFNLLEDDKHNIESEVKKTDFNVMNLANEEDVKLDLSASATQVN